MNLSIFLAKVLGIYLLVVSFAILFNLRRTTSIISGVIQNPSLQLIVGILTTIIGILLVVSHNIWIHDWTVVITIIGWLIFIKGVLNLVFPNVANALDRPFIQSKLSCTVSALISLAIGLYLCCKGFELKGLFLKDVLNYL
jgi:hypothetical protein